MIGMDPKVARYFKKILSSLFAGLMWLFINVVAGIYFELAYSTNYPSIIHVLFFLWLAASLGLLLWFLYKTWSK
jgi:hypothetical protein